MINLSMIINYLPYQGLQMITDIEYINKLSESKKNNVNELIASFSGNNIQALPPTEIRKGILESLGDIGCSSSVKIDKNLNITISSIKNSCGICVQFGNISRYYADILKLQYLYKNSKINLGIIVVPKKELTLNFYRSGGNLSSFERIIKEMDVLKNIITIPLAIVGVKER